MSKANRRRSPAQEFLLYDEYDAEKGWRVNRRISLKHGESLELAGRVTRLVDELTGEFIGWELQAEKRAVAEDEVSLTRETHELMNAHEIRLVAGLNGRSRTLGLPLNDTRRMMRVTITGRALPAEDPIERAVMKYLILTPRHLLAAAD